MISKVYFYFPSTEIIDTIPDNIDNYWPWVVSYIKNRPILLPDGSKQKFGSPYNWILQTFIYLRDAGFPCELTAAFPDEGIVFSHSNLLTRFQKPSHSQYIVEVKPDKYLHCIYANFVIVQNKRDPIHSGSGRFLIKSAVINNWPQPGLIPRDSARGDRFENICFIGNSEAFIGEIDCLESRIKALGLSWHIVPIENWHDYRQVDAIVAVRPINQSGIVDRKPITRLTNAWSAGVPIVSSPDIAFEDIRKSELDYLPATNINEIVTQIQRLKSDVCLRKAMSENGLHRAVEFSAENNLKKWINTIKGPIFNGYNNWTKSSFHRKVFFVKRILSYKLNGIDPDPR